MLINKENDDAATDRPRFTEYVGRSESVVDHTSQRTFSLSRHSERWFNIILIFLLLLLEVCVCGGGGGGGGVTLTSLDYHCALQVFNPDFII